MKSRLLIRVRNWNLYGAAVRLPFVFALFLTVVFSGAALPVFAQQRETPRTNDQIQISFSNVVKMSAPAVANIFAKKVVRGQLQSPLMNDPLMQRFFGGGLFGQGIPVERVQNTLGSGVIVREDGVIVTNNHVIENTTGIRVVLSDRREFDAEILLTDPRTDIAVLKINSNGVKLPSLPFADSDIVEVGDLVLAIGNPFGVGQTVTSGIVSATSRTQAGISDYQFFIQTDAAINPGNSGGGLVGLDGKLVGINTAIFSRSGGSIGIGFAIPSNMVRSVVESALGGKGLVRPWLGASGQAVTQDIAQSLGLDAPGGILISNIYPASPAEESGLRVGDIILKLDEWEISDAASLRYRIATGKVGQAAKLRIWRDGAAKTLTLPFKIAPEIPPRNLTKLTGRHPLSGVIIANLSPAYAEELELPGGLTGVIITEIAQNSAALQFGIRPGDIILAIGDEKMRLVDDVVRVSGTPRNLWDLRIRRGDKVIALRIGS